jgi:hypothetical protein
MVAVEAQAAGWVSWLLECFVDTGGDGLQSNDCFLIGVEESEVELTRFRGRLTRPNFGAEVVPENEQEGRISRAA